MYFFLLLDIPPYNEYYSTNITSWICQRKEKENIGVFFGGWSKVLVTSYLVARQGTTANGTRQNTTKPKTGEGRAIIKLKKV